MAFEYVVAGIEQAVTKLPVDRLQVDIPLAKRVTVPMQSLRPGGKFVNGTKIFPKDRVGHWLRLLQIAQGRKDAVNAFAAMRQTDLIRENRT